MNGGQGVAGSDSSDAFANIVCTARVGLSPLEGVGTIINDD